jgi:D-alanyl-lipoteichoic acid acyltransferase DltB (MBOAT superfamily)
MDDIVPGLRLIFWGIFKKVMIADNLGEYVNTVYNSPQQHTGLPLIIATLFFTLQIYCDFSGYSDIALGSARILGFRLMTNFSFPYFSRSIREFWGRWHISLSTWFRDYLYIPMGGNRVSDRRWMFNLFLVFVISGIWHGANWTFVVWGVLHGLYLIAGILISRRPDIVRFLRTKWGGYIGLFITFCLVSLAWIFFRARNVSEGFYILEHMGTRLPEQLKGILVNHHLERLHFLYLGFDRTTLGATCIAVFLLFAAERRAYRGHSELLLPQETPAYLRMGITGLSFLLLVFWGAFHSDLDFIYFQF